MSDIKQPQDHKQPVTGFEFAAAVTDAKGARVTKTFTLPLASKARSKLSGRDLRDAALGGEVGQVTYLFKVLEAAEPPEVVLDVLYAMPQDEMMDILQAWGEFGDGDGASLGK